MTVEKYDDRKLKSIVVMRKRRKKLIELMISTID